MGWRNGLPICGVQSRSLPPDITLETAKKSAALEAYGKMICHCSTH